VNKHTDLQLALLVTQKGTAMNNFATGCSPPLIQAAPVKLHSITRRSREIGLVSPKLMCRLFDTLMRPSLTCGSELWGVELGLLDGKAGSVAYAVDRVHLRYLRRNLGVKKGTTSTHVRGGVWTAPSADEHLVSHH
jgi:hypothetical protein